jgi:hypothetical protein
VYQISCFSNGWIKESWKSKSKTRTRFKKSLLKMEYLKSLENGLNYRKDVIQFVLKKKNVANGQPIEPFLGIILPDAIMSFYRQIEFLEIINPRKFNVLSIKEMVMENNYLMFSNINNTKICFDTRTVNSAGEWDIINFDSKFIITKTLASYLTSKMWAWIDRGREIWNEEFNS